MIGSSKNNRENYPRFWAQEKETANRPSHNWALGFGIRNRESHDWNRNLSPTDKESGIQYLKSGIHCVESRIQNPRLSWIPLHGAKGPIRRSELTLNWTWNPHTRQMKSLNLASVTQLILTLKICDARSVAVKYHVFLDPFTIYRE